MREIWMRFRKSFQSEISPSRLPDFEKEIMNISAGRLMLVLALIALIEWMHLLLALLPQTSLVLSLPSVLRTLALTGGSVWLYSRRSSMNRPRFYAALGLYIATQIVAICATAPGTSSLLTFAIGIAVLTFVPVLPARSAALSIGVFSLGAALSLYIVKPDALATLAMYNILQIIGYCAICLFLVSQIYHAQVRAFNARQDLADTVKQLEKANVTDQLTGVYNRRGLEQQLSLAWEHCRRDDEPLCALMIDIDWFKNYNDFYGHIQGDVCLERITQCMQNSCLRGTDIVARYGGEEFVILCYSDVEGGITLGERILRNLARIGLEHVSSPLGQVSVSIGVASVTPSDERQPADLINAADMALYQAKALGRNRCFSIKPERRGGRQTTRQSV